ncbi:MAG: lysophospholipid acyltransferase family protein [Desulfobacteraceae bacterium]
MFTKINFFPKELPNLSKFCQMKINCWLFRFLPFAISRGYLACLGKVYYFFNQSEKRLIKKTITKVYGRKAGPKEFHKMFKQALQGIFDHYHEKLVVAYSRLKGLKRLLKARVRTAGEEILQEAVLAGKGVLLVTGHFGAVELLPGLLGVRGYPVSMICRFKTGHLRDSLVQRAQTANVELIDADGKNILLAATKALKQGRILITECDEFDEWRVSNNKHLYFLGCRLGYDRTLDVLSKRSGAPVVSGLVKREGHKKYALNLTAISNGADSETLAVGEKCLKVLEEAIQGSPTQWYQWKKFGKMINVDVKEDEHDHQENGYLAPEFGLSVSGQA